MLIYGKLMRLLPSTTDFHHKFLIRKEKEKMKKLISFILASVLVACCFAVSASAADTNLAAGKSYTLVTDDETIAYNGTCEDGVNPGNDGKYLGLYTGSALLTDGEYRVGTEDDMITSDSVTGTTVELCGTNRIYTLTFDLGSVNSVSSVLFRVVKLYNNRGFNVTGLKVSEDGVNFTDVTFNKSFDVVANAEQSNAAFNTGGNDLRDPYYNVNVTFDAVNAQYVAVTFDTSNPGENYGNFYYVNERGYIVQFEEIEVYGSAASNDEPIDEPSEDPIEDPSQAPVESEDPAPVESGDDNVSEESEAAPESTPESTPDNSGSTTPETGDAGLAVFAVLAVVSLAGVVVAKKVK